MKKRLKHSGNVLLIAVAILCVFQLALTATLSARMLVSANVAPLDFTVVIDAGHGGVDGGVVGASGSVESRLNLLYAKSLGDIFAERGFRIVYTRKDEGGLYGQATEGFKRRDMARRAELIEQASPDVVISVHMNHFADGSRRGPQVFFQEDVQEGKALADSVQTALNDFTGNDHAALGGDFFITRCCDRPSVIVECGFLSNVEEESLLLQSDYREKLTETIFRGVMLYLYSV